MALDLLVVNKKGHVNHAHFITMASLLIIDKTHALDPYLKDIENIYTSNGWGTHYPPSVLRKMYGNCYYLIAIDAGSAIGLVRAFTDELTVTHLSEVVVEKKSHKRGVGSTLLTTVIADLGHTAIYTEALNIQAGTLFQKFGFQHKTKLTVYARKATSHT